MFFLKNRHKLLDEISEKETFIATIIHDLKNPLIAHCRILERIIKNTKEDDTKEYCKQLLSSTRLLAEMVFSASATYKYEHCKLAIKREEINLLDITKDVCLELSSLTEDESLLNIKVAGKPIISADKLHLRRVISNLISNAIRYKQDGSTIIIEINNDNKSLSYCVTNHGHYIPPKIQKELFKKYVTQNTKFNSYSTGLGLYLSSEIIKHHSGKMFLKSAQDGTNSFGFIIPNALTSIRTEEKSTR